MSEQYQAGYKLRDLKKHIETVVGHRIAKRLNAEMGAITLSLESKDMGHGMNIMSQLYQAEFYFERFPFNEYDPAVLFANIGAWLMDNDQSREDSDYLGDPEIDVTLEDENSAEIIITIDFEEPIKVVEDPNGPILWRGKTWKIEEYRITEVTKAEVNIRRA